jgi:phosphoribosylanthranilate isomerase
MFDTDGGSLPGGNARSFDWRILSGCDVPVPWMLAGGLTPDNVEEAVRITGAPIVDVSSGVESTRGVKSVDLIRAFLKSAHRAE